MPARINHSGQPNRSWSRDLMAEALWSGQCPHIQRHGRLQPSGPGHGCPRQLADCACHAGLERTGEGARCRATTWRTARSSSPCITPRAAGQRGTSRADDSNRPTNPSAESHRLSTVSNASSTSASEWRVRSRGIPYPTSMALLQMHQFLWPMQEIVMKSQPLDVDLF